MPTEGYIQRKKEYIAKYQKRTYSSVNFKLRTKEDADVLEALSKMPNKSEYIKNLIRKDLGLTKQPMIDMKRTT